MNDSLLGSFTGEFSHYLHFMSGFLKSPLVGYNLFDVAGPRMYARQLVGIVE